MARNAYFIRKGVVLDASVRKLDSDVLIPIKNIVIDTSSDENLDEIIVPSLGRTIQVINSLKDATADVKYYAIVIDQLTLPTASEIQMLYTSIADGEALLVQDTSDNAWKALSAFDKTVEILNNDGSTTTLQTIRAELNDGILYLVEQTGVYETAIFTAKGWQLDQTKNVVPAKLEDLYAKTELNANAIAVLEAWKTATDQRLGDNGEFLTKENNKEITSKGTIAFNGTPLEGGKIATRQDVGSGFATIKQTADSLAQIVATNKTAQDAIKTTADSAKTQSDTNKANIEHNRTDIDAYKAILDTAVTKNTEQDSKITALENAKTANDAKNLEQDTRLTATEGKANIAYTQAQDWAETKAQVALIADLNSPIENTTNIGITANGNNAEIILTAPAIAGLKEGKNVVLHFLRDNVTPKRANTLSAKYNDASETLGESLVIEGVVVPVTTSISNNKVVITGLNTTQLNTFITNYRLVLVEQASGAAGVSVDATARAKADSAYANAVQAQTDATYAKNKIDALDLTPLQTATATAQAKADQADGKANTNTTAITLLNTWKTAHVAEYNALNAIVGTTNADGTKTGLVKAVADGVAKDTAQDTEIAKKQNSSDQSLTTTDKTITGAINEINGAYKAANTALHTTITTKQDTLTTEQLNAIAAAVKITGSTITFEDGTTLVL